MESAKPCSKCTYLNPPNAALCQMCENDLKSQSVVVVSGGGNNNASSQTLANSASTPNSAGGKTFDDLYRVYTQEQLWEMFISEVEVKVLSEERINATTFRFNITLPFKDCGYLLQDKAKVLHDVQTETNTKITLNKEEGNPNERNPLRNAVIVATDRKSASSAATVLEKTLKVGRNEQAHLPFMRSRFTEFKEHVRQEFLNNKKREAEKLAHINNNNNHKKEDGVATTTKSPRSNNNKVGVLPATSSSPSQVSSYNSNTNSFPTSSVSQQQQSHNNNNINFVVPSAVNNDLMANSNNNNRFNTSLGFGNSSSSNAAPFASSSSISLPPGIPLQQQQQQQQQPLSSPFISNNASSLLSQNLKYSNELNFQNLATSSNPFMGNIQAANTAYSNSYAPSSSSSMPPFQSLSATSAYPVAENLRFTDVIKGMDEKLYISASAASMNQSMQSKKCKFEWGDARLLRRVQPLWELQKRHHFNVSRQWKEYYEKVTWNDRTAKFDKADLVFVGIAYVEQGASAVDVGYIVSSQSNNEGEIDSVYVREEFRNLKLGSVLCRGAIAKMKEIGAMKIKLNVAEGNEQSLKFYEKLGFKLRSYEMQLGV